METMKRSIRRLAISLLTIMAMVFTLTLCMGTEVAEAATNDLVQTFTPTYSCPVSKAEFVPQKDGQFNLKVTVNLDVLKVGDDYGFDLHIGNSTTGKYLDGAQGFWARAEIRFLNIKKMI